MPEPDQPLAFDDVVIDFAGRRLLRGGVEQPLEPKAFAVLALLAGTPGRAFTRDEILDAVWGHAHLSPGVLNRVMTLLRQALGEDALDARYLHTVHGVGYRLDLPNPEPPAVSSRPRADGKFLYRRAVLWALPLIAGLAIAGATWWPRPMPERSPATVAANAPPATERSIAVLPLVNAGGDKNQQFFSDGISEHLIEALSKYDGLKVIGRGSSFQFRDTSDDSRTIGRKLGVAYLLDGSVQRVGDMVRITATLIQATDGSTLWSEHYDRPYKDLFVVQDQITMAVVGALQAKLLHNIAGEVETDRPASGKLDAYGVFLRAHYAMDHDVAKAIPLFEEATHLDPNYAQAWQWLGFARTFTARQRLDDDAMRSDCALARKDIDTAIRIAPSYGHSYSALAIQKSSCDFDWNGALALMRKAIALVSSTNSAHCGYSKLLGIVGRMHQAIDERRICIAGDPLAAKYYYFMFATETSLGRLDDAETSLHKAMELSPEDAPWAAEELSYLAILRGNAKDTLAYAKQMPRDAAPDSVLALALQMAGSRAEADAALRRMIDKNADARNGPLHIARAYALRGDADGMFEWLERDWARRGEGASSVLNEPLLLRFRDDPRYASYCKRAKLPPPCASEALSIDQIRASLATRH